MEKKFDWEIPMLAVPFTFFLIVMFSILISYLYFPKADMGLLMNLLLLSILLIGVGFGAQRIHMGLRWRKERIQAAEEEEAKTDWPKDEEEKPADYEPMEEKDL